MEASRLAERKALRPLTTQALRDVSLGFVCVGDGRREGHT